MLTVSITFSNLAMLTDIRDNPLTGASTDQADWYNRLLKDYVDYRASLFKDLKALCQEAPSFPMAHIFKGYMLLSVGTQSTISSAMQCAEDACSDEATLTEQEALHLEALKAWSRGNTQSAVDTWEEIVNLAPLDLLALKLHHFALFWMGDAERMLHICEQMAHHWNDSIPGYANFLGMSAFAQEEMGNFHRAEELSRQAIELDSNDLWALHALAHTFEMQGRIDEGISLLDFPLDQFDDRNPFRGHLWWHLGMFAIEKGQLDRVLELYDKVIYADQSSFYLDMQNTASILARLEFCGVDVGDRWLPLAEVVKERQGDHVLAFTEPHHTMILARSGAFDEIENQISSLTKLTSNKDLSISKLVDPLVIPLCKAVRDYYRSSYQPSRESLARLENELTQVGGSHAQRDLFTLLQIQSAIEQEDFVTAQSLLMPRLEQRPNSSINWNQLIQLTQKTGDTQLEARAKEALSRIAKAA